MAPGRTAPCQMLCSASGRAFVSEARVSPYPAACKSRVGKGWMRANESAWG